MIVKPRSISGFADYTEAENVALSKWLRIVENEYRLFGFSRLIPRPVELREVLLSKGGIQKQIFGVSRLQNDMPTDMALPFDRTVPLAYWIAKNQGEVAFPYKRYDISYSYRGERAQAGRFQGFFQADVDIIGQGELDISADSETISVIYNALTKLGFKDAYICLNELKLISKILNKLNIQSEKQREILNVIDSINKISKEEFFSQVLSLVHFSESEMYGFWELFSFEGKLDDFILLLNELNISDNSIEYCISDIKMIIESLISSKISVDNIIFRPAIVRGLDYYTGIVFETFVKGYENLGSIASGGRYDNLSSTFTKSILPGVGGSIGITRLFDLAIKNGFVSLKQCSEADIFIGFREHSYKNVGIKIAYELRAKGYNVDIYSGNGNFKKQLSYADRKGFGKGIFIMDDNSFVLKNLIESTQVDYSTHQELINSLFNGSVENI